TCKPDSFTVIVDHAIIWELCPTMERTTMTATSTVVPQELATGTWNIDPVHSQLGFTVRHLMVSKVRGTFDDFTGQITIGADGTASVVADIKVESVSTRNAQRDEHIRSGDYFGVADHPVATFRSTEVRSK